MAAIVPRLGETEGLFARWENGRRALPRSVDQVPGHGDRGGEARMPIGRRYARRTVERFCDRATRFPAGHGWGRCREEWIHRGVGPRRFEMRVGASAVG